MDADRLTLAELLMLFDKRAEDTRWVAAADSQEYLATVTYVVQRSNRRSA